MRFLLFLYCFHLLCLYAVEVAGVMEVNSTFVTRSSVCPQETVFFTCSVCDNAITWVSDGWPGLAIIYDHNDDVGTITTRDNGFTANLTMVDGFCLRSILWVVAAEGLNGTSVSCNNEGNTTIVITGPPDAPTNLVTRVTYDRLISVPSVLVSFSSWMAPSNAVQSTKYNLTVTITTTTRTVVMESGATTEEETSRVVYTEQTNGTMASYMFQLESSVGGVADNNNNDSGRFYLYHVLRASVFALNCDAFRSSSPATEKLSLLFLQPNPEDDGVCEKSDLTANDDGTASVCSEGEDSLAINGGSVCFNSSLAAGTQARYACYQGYLMLGGGGGGGDEGGGGGGGGPNSTRQCRENGTWSGSVPACNYSAVVPSGVSTGALVAGWVVAALLLVVCVSMGILIAWMWRAQRKDYVHLHETGNSVVRRKTTSLFYEKQDIMFQEWSPDQLKRKTADKQNQECWRERLTPDGRVFFEGEVSGKVQWKDPTHESGSQTAEFIDIHVPGSCVAGTSIDGWIIKHTPDGHVYFYKPAIKKIKWTGTEESKAKDESKAREENKARLNQINEYLRKEGIRNVKVEVQKNPRRFIFTGSGTDPLKDPAWKNVDLIRAYTPDGMVYFESGGHAVVQWNQLPNKVSMKWYEDNKDKYPKKNRSGWMRKHTPDDFVFFQLIVSGEFVLSMWRDPEFKGKQKNSCQKSTERGWCTAKAPDNKTYYWNIGDGRMQWEEPKTGTSTEIPKALTVNERERYTPDGRIYFETDKDVSTWCDHHAVIESAV